MLAVADRAEDPDGGRLMGTRMTAINRRRPHRTAGQILIEVDRTLRNFALDLVSIQTKYPARKPWKPRADGSPSEPRSGPRKGGKRTGIYGKGWRIIVTRVGEIVVENRVEYAVYVGGDPSDPSPLHQTQVMRDRGWTSVTEEADKLIRTKYRNIMRSALRII